MSRELQILFNTEMVRAILDGRKTVTRRLVKPQTTDRITCGQKKVAAPYQPGDILYVRETWSELSSGYEYKADGENIDHLGNVIKWHPSIHMPKEAARIFLKVKDVRVERLQDITEEQAEKEGFQAGSYEFKGAVWGQEDTEEWTAVEEFRELWNSTIKKSDLDRYGWNANPWVWVIEFERIKTE